jgi:hypothetical protein
MAGFFLCVDTAEQPAGQRLAAARAAFESHGFTQFTEIATPGHRGFAVSAIHPGAATFHRQGEDFIAVAGTLFYKGMAGAPALAALLADFEFPFDAWDAVLGQFALLVRKAGRSFLLGDYFGAFQLYYDVEQRVFSTSLMAAIRSLPRVTLNVQAAYEFVFNSVVYGNDTVVEEVRQLDPRIQVELGVGADGRPTFTDVEKPLPTQFMRGGEADLVAALADQLVTNAQVAVLAYGDNVQTPLSAGYDSRLALALLRAAGARPYVYTYGAKGDEDVEIALAIGEAEGFKVHLFDKIAHHEVTPDEFPEIVWRNFDEVDAVAPEGDLFDNGGHSAARRSRQAGGALAVSGGCGEVMRNFFYLPDKSLSVKAILHAFYSQFDPLATTGLFKSEAYYRVMGDKLAKALGVAPGPLDRQLVEQAYPRFRCRSFFGREISLVGRFGGYFMPFLEESVVRIAVQAPLDIKNFGQFESQIIAKIDPALARHMSGYGHAFDEPPSRAHKLRDMATIRRPIWLRRNTYRLKTAMGMASDRYARFLVPELLGRVIDLSYPAMSKLFRIDKITDAWMLQRISNLEYFAGRLGSHLRLPRTTG